MSELTGTATLLRLAWRRDRVLIPVSLLALTALSVGSGQATLALYPDEASARNGLGSVLANPGIVAMYGPIGALNRDALAVFKTVLMGAVFVGLLAYAVVRRHTRVEEEVGRLELVGAGVVGRRAPLAAAVALAALAVVAAGVLSAIGLTLVGLDPTGSAALGAAWVVAGVAMVGVTAVAAQLTASARACAGIALGAMGVMFLLRAIGDTSGGGAGVLTWASPFGWASKVAAYGANRFWVLALAVGLAAVLVALAFWLLERRDLGAGLVPPRPGPDRGSASLGSPLGLVWRLTRPSFVGWLVAFVVLGSVLGSLLGSVEQMTEDPAIVEMLRALGGSAGTVTDIFLATELAFVSVAASAAGMTIALHVAGEEKAGRSESVLATSTSRSSWLAAHALHAVLLPAVLLLTLALVIGVVGAGTGDAPGFGELAAAAAARIPAMTVLVAVALLAAATTPTWAPAIGWSALALTFALGELGRTVGLPDRVIQLSPFAHVPHLPGGEWAWTPVLVTTAVAAAITAAAFTAYRLRDVT